MKIYSHILKIAVLVPALLAAFSSCRKEETGAANAALPETDYVSFAAKGAEPQTIWIYADGEWVADVPAVWLTMEPMYGTGNTEVILTVTDNVDEKGAMAAPRSTVVNVRGGYSERNGSFQVAQKGDTYLGKPEVTVTEAMSLSDGDMAKIPEAYVMALTTTGMVISDGTSAMLTDGTGEGVKIGDKVYLNGTAKIAEGQFPSFTVDECDVISSGTPDYPEAKDITGEIDSYGADRMEYVTVKGSIVGLVNGEVLAGAAIRVQGAGVRMMVAEVPAEMGLAALNWHRLTASGYFTGKSGSNLSFVPAVVKDEGLDESVVPVPSPAGTVLFEDDFDWMDSYIAAAVAAGTAIGSSVEENNASGAAPNLYTVASLSDLAAELLRRGYKDVNAAVKSVYPQNTYWKFGKTSNHTGLQLPPVDYYGELQVGFDWSPHMTGSGNIDKITLVVSVTTGASTVIAGEFSYKDWSNGQMAWHAAKATVNITPESVIQIRPSLLEDHDGITQQRFYVDNIVVKVPAPDEQPVYAVISVEPDDILTFEGEGGETALTVSSDQDYSITSSVSWLTFSTDGGEPVSLVEGRQNVPTELKVVCTASDRSKLREGKIIITSADSSKELRVIQSSAGGELEPFISIVGGNSGTVEAKASVLRLKVQSNVDFECEISDSWIQRALTTSSLVAIDELAFNVSANSGIDERQATIKFYDKANNIESVYTVNQLSDHAKLPVKWTVRSSCGFASTWPTVKHTQTAEGETGYINATSGMGTIWFNNANGIANDVDKKCVLDVSDKSPRVTGVWIGDYCQFKVPGKVDAGKKVKISFETRVSKTHPKYWRLQYLDGSEWKDAGTALTAEVDGEGTVTYTHQMANDGSTNIQVAETVTYAATTDDIVFRFICQTAMQANGSGCLEKPNGGSWRLSVTNSADDDQWQPTIQFVE